MKRINHIEDAYKYANDVVSGEVLACVYIRQVCQRFLDMLEDIKTKKRTDILFSPEKVQYVLDFLGLLTHTKSKWAGQRFKLSPWQTFIIAFAFGFLFTATNKRLIRNIYIECPRKQGKSFLLA